MPNHSTLSKNRHGRFRDGDVHRLLFEEVVRACAAAGLVYGRDVAVDASVIEADAGREHKHPGAAGAEAWSGQARVTRPVREYLAALDAALPPGPDEREPTSPKYTSPTDPAAAWSAKHGPGRFCYSANHMIDSETGVVLDVEATPARLGAEVAATRTLVTRTAARFGTHPERLAADKAYGSAALLQWLFSSSIEPHVPVIDRTAQTGGKLSRAEFTYDPAADVFTCPEGRVLHHRGYEPRTATHRYYARPGDCRICPRKPDCTDAPARRVLRMVDEDARNRARVLQNTPEFARSRRLRRRIDRLDRLARSVGHLLAVIEQLEASGAHFRSLRDPIDTAMPQGMFSLQVLGVVAQLERGLIAERTKAGLHAARARGRVGGNPGLRTGDPAAIRKLRAGRDAKHLDGVLAQLDAWLPTVRRMHPDQPWGDVVRVLNHGQQASPAKPEVCAWTVEKLRRTVQRLAREGLVEAGLLGRACRQGGDDRLVRPVAGIKAGAPGRTLQQIASRLEAMRERTPRGGTRWHPSSVKHLLGRAEQLGLAGTAAATVAPNVWR